MRKEGRTQVSAEGNPINWLCPSNPENVKLELNAITEIVRNYKVDGIHLDYIRYPGSHACYCTECRDRFILASKLKIQEWQLMYYPELENTVVPILTGVLNRSPVWFD